MVRRRVAQAVLIVGIVPLSWLAMMLVHESGHVAAAWATGGTVQRVIFSPLAFSRTDVSPNPSPLVVVWMGPVVGALLPLAAWGIAGAMRWSGAYLPRFFAGFCLVANGAYIGVGSFEKIGDAGEMLRHGSERWELWLFGLITIPAGFVLWHGLGPWFGLGPRASEVRAGQAWAVLALLILLVVVGLVV